MALPQDILAAQRDGRIPAGTDPEFLAETKDLGAIIGLYVALGVSTTIFLARLWGRCFVTGGFGLDDGLAISSWICFVAFIVLGHILINLGSARHYDYIQDVLAPDTVALTETLDFAAHLIYTTALFTCRLSGLTFYEQRIVGRASAFTIAIRIIGGLLTIAYIPQMLLIILHCKPVTSYWPYAWEIASSEYTCLSWGTVYSVNSAVSLASDLALFTLPAIIIWSLKCLSHSKRVKLACVIMPGILVVGISIARLVLVIQGQWEADESWYYGPMLGVEAAEIGSTLVALSAPALRPLFLLWTRDFTSRISSGPRGSTVRQPQESVPQSPTVELYRLTPKFEESRSQSDIL